MGGVAEQVEDQIEFYLRESNLPFDKFLFGVWVKSFKEPASDVPEEVPVDFPGESKDSYTRGGWIPLSTLTSFKRMQVYLEEPPKGLGGLEQVGETLLKAKNDVFEAYKFGDNYYVRRRKPLTKPEALLVRSVYAKGFPVRTLSEEEKGDKEKEKALKDEEWELQRKLEAWVKGLGVGKLLSLRMRRDGARPGQGAFKGSIFAEFADQAAADAFVALKPKYEDRELEVSSKYDYVEKKRQLHAPDSQPTKLNDERGRAFNAWKEGLISADGAPSEKSLAGGSRKRAAADEDAPEDTTVLIRDVKIEFAKGDDGNYDAVTVHTPEDKWNGLALIRVVLRDGEKAQLDRRAVGSAVEGIAKMSFLTSASSAPGVAAHLFFDEPLTAEKLAELNEKVATLKDGETEHAVSFEATEDAEENRIQYVERARVYLTSRLNKAKGGDGRNKGKRGGGNKKRFRK